MPPKTLKKIQDLCSDLVARAEDDEADCLINKATKMLNNDDLTRLRSRLLMTLKKSDLVQSCQVRDGSIRCKLRDGSFLKRFSLK